MSKKGLVLGKFMPLHKGHEYLLSFAGAFTEDVTVVVDCVKDECIPVATRVAWIKELYPHLNVVGLQDPTPQQPQDHPNFWKFWADTLNKAVGSPVDYLFASADYGEALGKALNATHISCDVNRKVIPISGTQIRNSTSINWAYLSDPAKRYYLKRVVLMGPESTGKSVLAETLATKLSTTWVPEYAAEYLKSKQGVLKEQDLEYFLQGQMAAQYALEPFAKQYLISDTDYLSTIVWGEVLYKTHLTKPTLALIPDLTLLLAPTVAWVKDTHREVLENADSQEVRWDFFNRCEEKLKAVGRRYVVISAATYPERELEALEAIQSL